MKKLLSLVLVAVLLMSLSAVSFAATYGLGVATSVSGKAATADKNGQTQVNSTIVAIVLDDEGKIVSAKIDVAQTKVEVNAKGEPVIDPAAVIKSKRELGDDYGMRKASKIEKGEWYEQAAAFEQFMIGKTVEEVLGIPTYKKDDHHTRVPEVEDLKTTVTIDVGAILDALQKAAQDAAAK